jgi:ankyrin repeat protein
MRWLLGLCLLLAGLAGAQGFPEDVDLLANGTVSEVEAWLKTGVNVNAPLSDGSLPLADASYNLDADVARLLLTAGADINAVGSQDMTPLMAAAAFGRNPEVVHVLLQAGADLRAVDDSGRTALMWAANLNPNPQIVRALLAAGADVHARDGRGNTVLVIAVALNNADVVKVLLEAGAQPDVAAQGGMTPLMRATSENCANVVKLLLNAGADASRAMPNGVTALSFVLFQGPAGLQQQLVLEHGKLTQRHCSQGTATEKVKLLLEAGADPNARAFANLPLITWAAGWRMAEAVTLLAGAGADPNARDVGGATPLFWAIASESFLFYTTRFGGRGDELATVHALLAAGADVNAVAVSPEPEVRLHHVAAPPSSTPLMLAARTGQLEVVRLLVQAGAKLDLQNDQGKTALILSMEKGGSPELTKLLVRSGADINIRDDDGKTALDYDYYRSSTYALLGGVKASADIFALAKGAGAATLRHVLVNSGVDVNAADKYRQTLLVYAADANPRPEMVDMLVNLGASVNARADHGWTPLLYAARDNPNPEVVLELLREGAGLELANARGMTAVMVAAAAGRLDMMRALVKAGADILSADDKGYRALRFTVYFGGFAAAKALVEAMEKQARLEPRELDGPLVQAVKHNPDIRVMKLLIAKGAQVNQTFDADRPWGGTTLFSEAVKLGLADEVAVLLADGARVNTRDHYGCTPLIEAAAKGDSGIVKALLEAGAHPRLGDRFGTLPLVYAAHSKKPLREDVYQRLKAETGPYAAHTEKKKGGQDFSCWIF